MDQTRQRYVGMEREEASGVDHTWWRTYDSSSGRWTSPDPYTASMSISDPQSFNRYSYVENDPLNRIDPSGLEESLTCYVDGVPMPSCGAMAGLLGSGAGVVGPLDATRFNYQTGRLETFHAYADGFSGYLPQGAVYDGNGYWSFPGAGGGGPPVLHDGLGTGTSYGQPLEGGRLGRTPDMPFFGLTVQESLREPPGGRDPHQNPFAARLVKKVKDPCEGKNRQQRGEAADREIANAGRKLVKSYRDIGYPLVTLGIGGATNSLPTLLGSGIYVGHYSNKANFTFMADVGTAIGKLIHDTRLCDPAQWGGGPGGIFR